MSPTQIILVKDSYRKIVPIADKAAALFYARLFELDPSLRPLFRGDIVEQGRKLMAMIGMAVGMLHRLDLILPQVREMGVRHAKYGVADTHYGTVGEALLWALEKGLGPDFTPEVRDAWISTYTLLATTMITAAQQEQETSPVMG
jgi:hemoglobin-like flavoprotein